MGNLDQLRYPNPEDRWAARINQMEDRIGVLERTQGEDNTGTHAPTLSATGEGLSIGDIGAATGSFSIINGWCHWQGTVVFQGAGVAAGVGEYRLQLPVAPIAGEFLNVGSGWLYSSGFYTASLDNSPGGSLARIIIDGGALSDIFPAAPVAGTVLSVSGSYPVNA